jgi:DNA-binding MarR family transcriptional regulator
VASRQVNLQVLLPILYDWRVLQNDFKVDVTDFAESVCMLVRRGRAAAANQELSWSEAGVLKRLARDGPATTADLARVQGMRPQSMRPIVATLEDLGMVVRRPHATDGRQVMLELTEKGAALQKSVGEAKRTWLAEAVAGLEPEEQETLFEAGRILRRMAEGGPR